MVCTEGEVAGVGRDWGVMACSTGVPQEGESPRFSPCFEIFEGLGEGVS